MNKKYIVIFDDEEDGFTETETVSNYGEALKKANSYVDDGRVNVKVCEIRAEVVVSKRFVEY